MAHVPVPGTQLTDPAAGSSGAAGAEVGWGKAAGAAGAAGSSEAAGSAILAAIPTAVRDLLAALRTSGHAAYVVGGSLRDVALGRQPADWDLASNARPEQVVGLFPGAVYENRFGTVAVRHADAHFEITTFRTDHEYADFRRPHRVEFGETIEVDLARRDFTVNAMAWGARPGESPRLIDPYDGLADIERRLLRAVGDPGVRFEEDALRMIRAVRLTTTLDFEIETATLTGIEARAELVAHLSGERIAMELDKLLGAPLPSVGLRMLAETGLLTHIAPELAAQRGVAQNKIPGEDLWDHTLRAVDAVPVAQRVVRMAALLHDIGKPSTLADGHFPGHDLIGAEMATGFLDRLRWPRADRARVVDLVRQHMWNYEPGWSDAAVRRFIGRIAALGPDALEQLLELREADNVGSGLPAMTGGIEEVRERIARELAADAVLSRAGLAIDGADLIAELGVEQGPRLGRILDDLVERVITEPALNDRPTLLRLAQALLKEDR